MSLLDDMLAGAGTIDNTSVATQEPTTGYELPEMNTMYDNAGSDYSEPVDTTPTHQLPDGADLFSYKTPESKYNSKKQSIEEKAAEKEKNIDPVAYYAKERISVMDDADSGSFANGNEWRAKGYDSYEVFHPGQLEDQTMQDNGRTTAENTRARLDRQKERYSAEYGVPRQDVTDKMIYDSGYKDMLNAYRDWSGVKGTKDDFDPESVDVSQYSNPKLFNNKTANSQQMTFGTADTPLDIAIAQRRNEDGSVNVGRYGREISDMKDLKTGQSLNDQETDRYNLTAYKDGRFDKVGAEDKLSKILSWPGTKPSEMTDPEEIKRWENYKSTDEQGWVDRKLGLIKSAALGVGGDVLEFARQARILDDTPEARKDINKLIGSDPKSQAWRDSFAGLQANAREDKDKTYQDALKLWSKEKGLFNKSTAKSLPEFAAGVTDTFAESTPEMAMIMAAAPFMVLNRTVKQDKDFYSKNKRHFNEKEMYIIGAWNAINIYAEKAGLEFGLKKFIQMLGPKNANTLLGKTGEAAGGLVGGALFEFLQETSEGTVDKFANQTADNFTLERAGEIAIDPETTAQGVQAAMTAGGMVGVGATAANTYKGAKKVLEPVGKKIKEKADELKTPYDDGTRNGVSSEQGRVVHDNVTTLFSDIEDDIKKTETDDGKFDTEAINLTPEESEKRRNDTLDAAVNLNELPNTTDEEIIERGNIARYLYNTVFGDEADANDIDMSDHVFPGEENQQSKEKLKTFLESEMKNLIEAQSRINEKNKTTENETTDATSEPEPTVEEQPDVGSETETSNDVADTLKEFDINSKDRDEMTPDEYTAWQEERGKLLNRLDDARAKEESTVEPEPTPEATTDTGPNGKIYEHDYQKEYHETLSSPFNENKKSNKKKLQKAEKNGDYSFIDNPEIRSQYEEIWSNKNDGKKAKSADETQSDITTKKDFDKRFGEVKQKEKVVDKKQDDVGSEDNTDTSEDSTPLGAMGPKTKESVKVEKIENQHGTIQQRPGSKRKTEKRVAGFVSNDSFLSTFLHGSMDPKGLTKLKFSAQQKNGSSKSIIRSREKMLTKLYNVVSDGLSKAHKSTKNTFDALMTNKDGSAKPINEQGAIAGRLAVISMHKIIEDIKSNVDRTIGENNLPLEQMYALRQNIAKEIGRSFVESYGLQMTPKTDSAEDNNALNQYYIEIGNVGIELAKEMGYVETLGKNDSVFDTGYNTLFSENNKDLKYEPDVKKTVTTEELMGTSVPLATGEDVLLVPEEYLGFKGVKGNESSADVSSSIASMISPIMKALLPANERQPQNHPSTQDVPNRGHDNESSPAYQDIAKQIQEGEILIDPEVITVLHDVAKIMQKTGKRLNQIAHMPKYEWLNNMFEMEFKKDVSPSEELSAKGTYISRFSLAESVMQMFLDNMDENGNLDSNFQELYFTYFKALNERLHVDEIPFNFQADKMFSRFATVPSKMNGEYTFDSGEITDPEWKAAVNHVIVDTLSDELGITPEELIDSRVDNGSDTNILHDINEVINDFVSDGDLAGFLSTKTKKSHSALFDKFKSPMQLWRLLNGVYDVREAYIWKESGEKLEDIGIVTEYSPEFDANNSGFMNKLLNALGSLNKETRTKIVDMLKALTIGDKNNNGKLSDAYNILTDNVKKKIESLKNDSKNKNSDDTKKQIELLEKVIDFIEKTDGMRNLSKYPLLAGIYGQGQASLSRNLGLEITKSIMNHGRTSEKEGIHDQAYDLLKKDPTLITRSDMRAIASEIGNIMGEIYSESLNTLEEPITNENKLINDAYKELEQAALLLDEDLTLRSPFEVTMAKFFPRHHSMGTKVVEDIKNAKYVFSIMKRKNVVTDHKQTVDGASETYMTEQKFMPNPNSIRVIPLHAIDTAVMLMAYVKTIAEMRSRGREMGGSMPIHDAVIGSPEFMEIYRRMYNEAALDVAEAYDIRNETANLIDRMLTKLKNHKSNSGFNIRPEPLISSLEKLKAEFERNNDKRMEQKKEDLDFFRENGAQVFGTTHEVDSSNLNENTKDLAPRKQNVKKENATKKQNIENEQLAERENEVEEISNKKGRVDKERKANKDVNFFDGNTDINEEMSAPPTREAVEKNNKRIEDIIKSEEPYVGLDLETTFGEKNASEIVQFAAGVYRVATEVADTISDFFLPSNALKYANDVKRAADKGKYYLKYSTINENAKEGTSKKIPGEKSELNRTRSVRANSEMRKAIKQIKDKVKAIRESEGFDSSKKIPIIAYNGMTFDFQKLMSNLGDDILNDFEILDATYLAYEQKNNGIDKVDGETGVHFTSLSWFMDKNDVEFENGVEDAHDGKYDIRAMVKSIVNYVNTKEDDGSSTKVDETWAEMNSTSIRDLIKALTSEEPREVRLTRAKKILNNMIDSKMLSEDGKKHAQDLIAVLSHKRFDAEFKAENKGRGELEFFTESNIIDTTDANIYNIKDTNDLLKYLMHETEHWVSGKYIKNEFKKGSNADPHIKFLTNFLESLNKEGLIKLFDKYGNYDEVTDSMDNSVYSRLAYILGKKDVNGNLTWEAIAELVAIFRAEPEFRAFIENEFKPSLTKRITKSIVGIMNNAFGAITNKMIDDTADFTAVNIANAIDNVTQIAMDDKIFNNDENGNTDESLNAMNPKNEVEMIDESLRYREMKVRKPVYLTPLEDGIASWNNAIYKFFKSNGFEYVKIAWDNDWRKKFHKNQMKKEESVYYRTVEVLKERFEPGNFGAKVLDYAGSGRKRGDKRDQALTIWLKSKQDRNRIDLESKIRSMRTFNKIAKKMKLTDKNIASLNSFFGNSLIHTLDESMEDSSILESILNSTDPKATIDEEIQKIVSQLNVSLIDAAIESNGGINKYASDIAAFLETGIVGSLNVYENPFGRLGFMNHRNFELTEQLIALNQLSMKSNNDLEMLANFKKESAKKSKEDSFNEFIGVSRSNAILSWEVDKDTDGKNQYRFDNITGNQILFDERYIFQTVDEAEFGSIDQNDNDVIVLQEPNDRSGTIGLVAFIDNSFGYQAGIASEISVNNDGVSVPFDTYQNAMKKAAVSNGNNSDKTIRTNSNIIRSNNKGYNDNKIIFTKEMLAKLKIKEHPAESLYNAYGHNIQIEHGKAALKWLLEEETTNISSVKEAEKFEKRIKDGKSLPHFVNFTIDKKLLKNYPNIMKTYKNTKGLSNVFGFNRRVNMVHRTTAYQMAGYKRNAIFRSRNMIKAERVWRNLITGFKTRVAILSPKKIGRDALASFSILSANEVPYKLIGSKGKQFMAEYPTLIKQRNDVLAQELKLYSTPKKINGEENPQYKREEKKLELLKKKLSKNPIYPALQRGFIQSLSTSVLTIEKEAVSDYQKQFNEIVELIDDIPGATKWIMKIANFGLGIEDLAKVLKKGTDKTKSKVGSDYLEGVAKKFEGIKSDEDLAAYLSELLGNPGNTEMTKVGGSMVMMVDVLLKWILFNHFLSVFEGKEYNYMTTEEKHDKAADMAASAAIKYGQNLPEELQAASDIGAWIFPQFIIQIQAVIFGLLARKLLSSSAQIGLSTAVGGFDESIFSSAIPYKMPASILNQYDGNPLDPNMIYPDQLVKDIMSLL